MERLTALSFVVIKGVMHLIIFKGAKEGGGGGHVTHISHNSNIFYYFISKRSQTH